MYAGKMYFQCLTLCFLPRPSLLKRYHGAYVNQANCFNVLGMFTDALANCNTVLKAGPLERQCEADAHFQRGIALMKLHRSVQALDAFDATLEVRCCAVVFCCCFVVSGIRVSYAWGANTER